MLARMILLAVALIVAGAYLLRLDVWAAWLAFAGSAAALVVGLVAHLRAKRAAEPVPAPAPIGRR